MNKKSHIIFALLTFASGHLWAVAQTDPTMNAIKDYTYQTAEHTAKGAYDHWALGISLFAFIVGAITLGFTYLTYKSQKKTEINTRRWNSKQERTNLRYMFLKLMDAASVLSYFERERIRTQGTCVPDSSVLEELLLDEKELHADEYIGEGIDYNILQDLRRGVIRYNTAIRYNIHELQNLRKDYAYPYSKFFCHSIETCYELIKNFLESYDYMFTTEEKNELHREEKKSYLQDCPLPIVSDLGLYRYVRKKISSGSEFKKEFYDLLYDFREWGEFCLKLKDGKTISKLKEDSKRRLLDYFHEVEIVTDTSLLFPYMVKVFPSINSFFEEEGLTSNKLSTAINNYLIERDYPEILEPVISIINNVFAKTSLTNVVIQQMLIDDYGSITLDQLSRKKEVDYDDGIPQVYTPADGGTFYDNVSENKFYEVVCGKEDKYYIPLVDLDGDSLKKQHRYYGFFKKEMHKENGDVHITPNIPLEHLNKVSKLILTNNNEKVLNTVECSVELEGVSDEGLINKNTGFINIIEHYIVLKILSVDKYKRKIKC